MNKLKSPGNSFDPMGDTSPQDHITNLQFPFEPYGANIIMEGFLEAEKIGSIIVPEQARRPLTQGQVLKVGPNVPKEIQPGCIVIFALHSDSVITIDGKKFIVIQEENIYAYKKA